MNNKPRLLLKNCASQSALLQQVNGTALKPLKGFAKSQTSRTIIELGLNVELPSRLSVILTEFKHLCRTSSQTEEIQRQFLFYIYILKKCRIRVVKSYVHDKFLNTPFQFLMLPFSSRILFFNIGKCSSIILFCIKVLL